MAAQRSGRPTFPVWVGSLKETVRDGDLERLFAPCGPIASVSIKRDDATGRSKGFGWVNFNSRAAAEDAAVKMAGRKCDGAQIKTRGPSALEKKGVYSPPSTAGRDFRPLMDCSFFIQGNHCKNGDACVYRHSVQALSTPTVCPDWLNKQCSNRHCPMRHPGARESSRKSTSSGADTPPLEGGGVGSGGVQVCGGRCGDHSCMLSFSSAHTLSQHIQLGQLQCTSCQIVFDSQAELQEHRRQCSRSHNDSVSTDTPSPSLSDVEVLSDSESFTSEDSFKHLPQKHSQPSPVKLGGSAHVHVPVHTTGGAGGGKRRHGRKKAGVSGSSANVASQSTATKMKTRKSSSETALSSSEPGGPSRQAMYDEEGGNSELSIGGVMFEVGIDSSESSDEDDLTYTSAEMAQLLSLNEQDMHPYMGNSESEEEGDIGALSDDEDEGKMAGEDVEKKRGKRQRSQKKEADPGRAKSDSSSHRHSSPPPPSHRHPAQSRQPEPVGLFWDIENCSVPANKSAFGVAAKMRRVFFEGKREAEFMVVCDITKERKEVTDALNKAQVTLVHVNAVAKNAADDKLRQSLRRFAHTYPAPSTVVLVSSDVNFSSELSDLRHVHNLTIVLVHSRFTSDALKVFAHQQVDYELFLEDVEAPKEAQRPSLPNILLVTNLPKNFPPRKLSSRLGQLSDNCGGRVLKVDPVSGTARILFRTPEWAMKAEKRMKGEDVFGSRINLYLDYSAPLPQPQPPHRHQAPSPLSSHVFHQLSGPALGKSFPPTAPSPANYPPMQMSPPPPRSASRPFRHPGPVLPPGAHNFPPRGPPHGPPPQQYRPDFYRPLVNSPFRGPPPPRSPGLPPSLPRPPLPPPGHAPYSHVAAIPAPRPEGKILIFKIPAATEENSFAEMDRQVLSVILEACIKAGRLVLWHSYSEMQVLLRLDFLQTAIVKKDDLIRMLWEKGDLRPKVAEKFVEQCVKSLADLCCRQGLPWQVTACGWTEEEEADRVTRSQVIALLRRYSLFWVKWNRFKTKYNENYHCALSEMAVHTACKGAVMILGKPDNNQSQVIIRYEMSPLVRVASQKQACSALVRKVVAMLTSRPEHKLKLLNVVREFTNEMGPLPISANGKPLQDVLSSSPLLQFVGSKPSSIYLTLVHSPSPTVEKMTPAPPSISTSASATATASGVAKKNSAAAGDLDILTMEFRHLLRKQTPNCELPLSRLQQEYQTLFHHSFRVSDYVTAGEGSKMKALVEVCAGLKLKDVRLPNNKVETIVYLASEQLGKLDSAVGSQGRINVVPVPVKEKTQGTATEQPSDSVADCERRVHDLLCTQPDYQITQDRFMSEYEKMYGARMSYYGNAKLSALLESFNSTLHLEESKGPNRLIQLHPIHVLAHELTVLLSAHGGQLAINKIVPEYKEKFGKNFNCSQFGFTKLIRALEAIPDTIKLVGSGPSRIAVLKKRAIPSAVNPQMFGDEVTALLLSTHTKKISVLDLTKQYNQVFRNPTNKSSAGNLLPISPADLEESLRKMPGFNFSGSGPVLYVQLSQQQGEKNEKKKEKTKASSKQKPQQPTSAPLFPPPPLFPSPPFLPSPPHLPQPSLLPSPPLLPPPTNQQQTQRQVVTATATEPVVRTESLKTEQPRLQPNLAQPTATATMQNASSSGTMEANSQDTGGSSGQPSLLLLGEKESQRLSSETQRLLQCHHEHAMTVSELAQCFEEMEDPARPQPDQVYLCLVKFNSRKGGSKSPKTFQVSVIPGSVGDSVIQLNRVDCLWKLGRDLLYLFVYRPTPKLALPMDHMLSLYQQCYGRKFVPAVYAVKSLEGVIETVKTVSDLMKLDETKKLCSLTDLGRHRVMCALLAELLFLHGEECRNTDVDLPRLFQQHLSIPLPLAALQVDSPSAMLALPEIQNWIQVTEGRPELKNIFRFAEQLRFLLTQNNGRLPLDSLQGLYISAFGPPPDTGGKDWLDKKMIHYAPHVVNLAGHKWAVWAPTGRPYPVRNSNKSLPSLAAAAAVLPSALGEWPRVDSEAGAQGQGPVTDTTAIASSVEAIMEMEEGGREVGLGREKKGEMQTEKLDAEKERQYNVEKRVASTEERHVEVVSVPSEAPAPATTPPLMSGSPSDALPQYNSEVRSTSGMTGNTVSTELEYLYKPLGGKSVSTGVPPPPNSSTSPSDPKDFWPLEPPKEEAPAQSGNQSHPFPLHSAAEPVRSSSPGLPAAEDDDDDLSPYGFLRKEPQLLAELTVKEEDNTLSTIDALEQLIAAGRQAHDFDIPDLPPPPPLHRPSKQRELPRTVDSNLPDGSTDYLKAGLNPDEVLEELYRVKDLGGGVINPASMEPFLNYFGELSSRELERLESQQAKPKTPTPTKGMLRKKRKMAIRFPGQDPDPSTIDPELQKMLDSVQLPEIPSPSDDSDDSDTCPRPVTRAELLEQLMDKDYFSSSHEGGTKDSETSERNGEGSLLLPTAAADPVGSSAAAGSSAVPQLFPESGQLSSNFPSLSRYYEQGKSGRCYESGQQ